MRLMLLCCSWKDERMGEDEGLCLCGAEGACTRRAGGMHEQSRRERARAEQGACTSGAGRSVHEQSRTKRARAEQDEACTSRAGRSVHEQSRTCTSRAGRSVHEQSRTKRARAEQGACTSRAGGSVHFFLYFKA
ncbi:uncharacterized [Tachysurus ichikawai]